MRYCAFDGVVWGVVDVQVMGGLIGAVVKLYSVLHCNCATGVQVFGKRAKLDVVALPGV